VAAASVIVRDDQERSSERHVDLAAWRAIAEMQPISGWLRGSRKGAFISGHDILAGPIRLALGVEDLPSALQHDLVIVIAPSPEPCREGRRRIERMRRDALLRQPARRVGAASNAQI